MMFRGIHAINMDAKGRFAIPSRYRAVLPPVSEADEASLVVTIDTEDTCLLLYPLTAWMEIEQKITALPSFNPATRRIQRLLIGHATELSMDSHGRILLPPLLREYAQLDAKAAAGRKLMLVGQGKKFEIWHQAQWEAGCADWLGVDAAHLGAQASEYVKDLSL